MMSSYRLHSAIATKAMLILALFVQSTAHGQASDSSSLESTPKDM